MTNIQNAVIPVIVGDHSYPLNFTLQDSTGAALDISTATLAFNMQLVSDSSVQTTGTMAVDDGTSGTCHYTVSSSDFPVAGTYNAQVLVTFGPELISFGGITVIASAPVPTT
jgi:hypothetical protein